MATKHPTVTCAECGAKFPRTRADSAFCTEAHKSAFHNRSSKVGRSLVPLLQAWRAGRNIKGSTPKAKALKASASRAFSEACRILDEVNSQDSQADRTPKLNYLRRRWAADGTLTPEERIPA